MSDCDRMIDVEALIDGEAGQEAAAIERHMRACPACRAYRDDIRRNDALLRRAARGDAPVPELEARLFGSPARAERARPVIGRRMMLGGLGVAACAAGLGLMLRPPGAPDAPGPLAATDFRMAVLGDFATHIVADRPLDIQGSDTARIVPWVSARVPFVLPGQVTPEGTRLLGGRLCWLIGRRLAAFSFEVDDARIGLYIAGADGLTGLSGEGAGPVASGRDGLQGAFWRDRGLALGLVGPMPASRLLDLAGTLRG